MEKDILYLAKTIYGEARGELIEGKVAVANVLKNRLADSRWPSTLQGVALQPRQFSCWNPTDPNYNVIQTIDLEDPDWSECLWVAEGIFTGKIKDNTQRSNHYFSKYISPPPWSENMSFKGQIGKHLFYQG